MAYLEADIEEKSFKSSFSTGTASHGTRRVYYRQAVYGLVTPGTPVVQEVQRGSRIEEVQDIWRYLIDSHMRIDNTLGKQNIGVLELASVYVNTQETGLILPFV